ncbi:hypothetical protein ATN89_17430 [Comamonas thiooxydans]|nr:hypothetical protein ATN89_17430 [Comamonas thiooxydans]
MPWPVITGRKKGAGGGGGAVEADNTLRSKSFARVLDLVSEGEIEGLVDGARSIYLNETPLENKDGSRNFDAAVEFRNGTLGQAHMPGFSAVENEVSVNVEVLANRPVTRSITNENLNAIRVKLRIPSLTTQDTGNGNLNGAEVSMRFQMESANSGVWITVGEDRIVGKTTAAYEREYRFPLQGSAPWQFRMVRLSPDSDKATVNNKTIFSSYTEIVESKLNYANSAIVGLTVDAEAFDAIPNRAYDMKLMRVRVPSNYTPATRSYAGSWDGSFKIAWTDNPAWCFYDLLTNERYGLGREIPKGSVDKWTLYTIGKYCDELVSDGRGGMEPRYTLNCYVQARVQAYELVKNMASAFSGMAYMASGSIVPVQDRPALPEYLFTNSNVINGKFSYQGSSISARHTVALVTWNDLNDFGRQKVEYVEDAEGIRKYGIIETEVAAYGCTSRGQAHRFGRAILASERLLTETVTFSTGIEGVAVSPGMVIKLRDNLRYGKRLGGRIKKITPAAVGDTDRRTILTLDAPVAISTDSNKINIMLPGGLFTGTCQWVNGTAGDQVRLNEALPTGASAPIVGATWVISASGDAKDRLYRVLTVAEDAGDNGNEGGRIVSITALEYDERKYSYADNLDLLEDDPGFIGNPGLSNEVPAAPDGLEVEVVNASRDQDTYIGNIEMSWPKQAGVTRWDVELLPSSGNPVRNRVTGIPSHSFDGLPAGEYVVRVRSLNFKGSASTWATSAVLALGFKSVLIPETGQAVQPPFASMSASNGFLSIVVGWKLNPAIASEINAVEVWAKEADPNSPTYSEPFKLMQTVPSVATAWTHQDLAPGAERQYKLRAIDKRGIHSDFYPTDRVLKAKANTDVTDILNGLEESFKRTGFFSEVITEIEKIGDLTAILTPEALEDLTSLSEALNVDLVSLREELRSVGWKLQRDGDLLLRSVVLTEEVKNSTTNAIASLREEVVKLATDTDTAIGKVSELIAAQQVARDKEIVDIKASIKAEESARVSADSAEAARVNALVAEQTGALDKSLKALISLEESARTTADGALSTRIEQLAATLTTETERITGLVTTEQTARAAADEALGKRVDTVYAEMLAGDTASVGAVKTETEARTTADTALGKRIDTVYAELKLADSSTAASVGSEATARTNADTALGKRIDTVYAELKLADSANTAAVGSEALARTTADEAIAKTVTELTATVKTNDTAARALIQAEATARTTADSAMTTRIDGMQVSMDAEDLRLSGLIVAEQKARADADGVLTKSITAMQASLSTEAAALRALIQTESTARVSRDEALTILINSSQTEFMAGDSKLTTLIQTEEKSRITADTALGTRITNLTSTVTANDSAVKALIQTEERTRATEDSALSTRITNLTTTVSSNLASTTNLIQNEATARADGDSATTSLINSVTSRLDKYSATGKPAGSYEAVLAAEQKTRADADSVLTKSITDMVSRLNTFDATGKPVNSVEARLAKEESTRATADSANATSITQLTARLNTAGGGSVTMEQKFSTLASSISGTEAKYSVKVNNKGHVSGFGLISTANNAAPTSSFIVASDKFIIATPETSALATTSTPFQVLTTATTINGQTVNPGVYISEAFIKNGVITSAKIGNLQVETLKIKDQAVTQAIYHQFSGTIASGDTGWLGDARIMTGGITCSGSGTSGGTFKLVMTANFLLRPVGDVAAYKGTNLSYKADIIRIDPWGGETVVRSGLVIGYSRAFSTALYAYGMGSIVLTYVDTIVNANAGRWQYAIRVYGEGGNLLGFSVTNRTMMLQEIKK